jgi:glutamine synthetase
MTALRQDTASSPTTVGSAQQPAQLTPDRLRERVAAGEIDSVLVAVPDMQGRLKGKRHDARDFLDRIAGGGADMCAYVLATDTDMRPLPGYELASWHTGYGDMRLLPDLPTLRVLPWMRKTALVHADAVHLDGRPIEVAPRQVLRRQLDRLAGLGYVTKGGVETEFVLYQGTYAQAAASDYRNLQPVAWDNLDYALDHSVAAEAFFHRLQAGLAGAGLPVEAVKTEAGHGQVEITFPYGEPMAACDGHTIFKHAVRRLAERSGVAPTFMAAPATGLASGCHLHVSLWRDGKPQFANPDGQVSALARQVIGGLLDTLGEFAPLYAPTVNSYKRFTPDSFAPTRLTWGIDNRTCAIRVTGHGDKLHLEVRLPGADANPYLALAAVLAAACHGIEHDLPLPPPCTGSAYQAVDSPQVPATLHEAVGLFRDSPAAHRAFGSDVVRHYSHAGQVEIDTHQVVVTDAELRRGFTRS